MNQGPKNLSQQLSQTQPIIVENSRSFVRFGCSSTPAPTPPVSIIDYWNSGVGAGISNNQIGAGGGVKEKGVKSEVVRQQREKPPSMSLTGLAGFFTLFPEGMTPSGSLFFKPYFRRKNMEDRRKNDRRAMIQDFLMTEGQAADMAKVSVNTIRYWRQVGKLPSVKVGKHPRIWYSVFLRIFQNPLPFSPFEAVKIEGAGDIRRAV
jgi:hypothetical protein